MQREFEPVFFLFIYLWLHWVSAALQRLSLAVVSGVYSSLRFVAVRGFLIAVGSLVAEHGL